MEPSKESKPVSSEDDEIAALKANVKTLERENKSLRDCMDAMVSDIARSEALAEENCKARDQIERECFQLARKVEKLSMTQPQQKHYQDEGTNTSKSTTTTIDQGTQSGMSNESIRMVIEKELNKKVRQREEDIRQGYLQAMDNTIERLKETSDVIDKLEQAEATISFLRKQNQIQFSQLEEMPAKQETIDQLQSVVEHYKTKSQRLSEELKDLKKEFKHRQKAFMVANKVDN